MKTLYARLAARTSEFGYRLPGQLRRPVDLAIECTWTAIDHVLMATSLKLIPSLYHGYGLSILMIVLPISSLLVSSFFTHAICLLPSLWFPMSL